MRGIGKSVNFSKIGRGEKKVNCGEIFRIFAKSGERREDNYDYYEFKKYISTWYKYFF